MASIVTDRKTFQHFQNLTGTNDVSFPRPINTLLITTTGTVNMSFDGNKFMNVPAGTHQFYHLCAVSKIFFTGGGTYEGCGIANQ